MGSSTRSTGTSSSPTEAATRSGHRLRILVVNWQDRLNPHAGGAEVHLHEIFGRLARRGHRVQLLTSAWNGAPGSDNVDGMQVRRIGGRYTFPLHARRAFGQLCAEHPFDAVVEDINKLPLFTPRWTRLPVVGLVPHLFGTTAFLQESWPVAAIVWGAEKLMLPTYRDVPFQVISRSTADDLAARGFRRDRIEVIYPGLDHERFNRRDDILRFEAPTLVYVGRLKRYKGLDVAMRGFARLREWHPEARLVIAGRGDDGPRLGRLAQRLGVATSITFEGFVSEDRKVELLRRAWANLYPSPKEGWGITNVEAAACGTPSVASDSPGLRETVVDRQTGFLVPHDDSEAWAEAMKRLIDDPGLRDRLAAGAQTHAARFSWDQAAIQTERSIAAAVTAHATGRAPRV